MITSKPAPPRPASLAHAGGQTKTFHRLADAIEWAEQHGGEVRQRPERSVSPRIARNPWPAVYFASGHRPAK